MLIHLKNTINQLKELQKDETLAATILRAFHRIGKICTEKDSFYTTYLVNRCLAFFEDSMYFKYNDVKRELENHFRSGMTYINKYVR